ncbi:MAG: hypothetical protein ACR2QJ_10050 [Geminicoccaceae bacterium]
MTDDVASFDASCSSDMSWRQLVSPIGKSIAPADNADRDQSGAIKPG